jgi:hypothetical protein
MLGGRNQRAVAIAQNGCEFGGDDGFGGGLNFTVATIEAGADKNKTRIDGCRSDRLTFSIPKSRQTIVTASNSANSRFFTDCYPISAVFTPKLDQIGPSLRSLSHLRSNHEIRN